jgi:hypothetical protein
VNANMRPAYLELIDEQSLVKVNFYYNISSIKEIFFHYLIFVICQ